MLGVGVGPVKDDPGDPRAGILRAVRFRGRPESGTRDLDFRSAFGGDRHGIERTHRRVAEFGLGDIDVDANGLQAREAGRVELMDDGRTAGVDVRADRVDKLHAGRDPGVPFGSSEPGDERTPQIQAELRQPVESIVELLESNRCRPLSLRGHAHCPGRTEEGHAGVGLARDVGHGSAVRIAHPGAEARLRVVIDLPGLAVENVEGRDQSADADRKLLAENQADADREAATRLATQNFSHAEGGRAAGPLELREGTEVDPVLEVAGVEAGRAASRGVKERELESNRSPKTAVHDGGGRRVDGRDVDVDVSGLARAWNIGTRQGTPARSDRAVGRKTLASPLVERYLRRVHRAEFERELIVPAGEPEVQFESRHRDGERLGEDH